MIGLVSWSKGCGRKFRPSVWTRMEAYTNWILHLITTPKDQEVLFDEGVVSDFSEIF